MNKIYATTKDQMNMLEKSSALTLEGLSEDSIPDFVDWVKSYSEMTKEDVYVISGKTMNNIYKLTGNNKYADNLTIVSIPLSEIKNVDAITLPRFQIGGRWFDDIVDNNSYREGRKE